MARAARGMRRCEENEDSQYCAAVAKLTSIVHPPDGIVGPFGMVVGTVGHANLAARGTVAPFFHHYGLRLILHGIIDKNQEDISPVTLNYKVSIVRDLLPKVYSFLTAEFLQHLICYTI